MAGSIPLGTPGGLEGENVSLNLKEVHLHTLGAETPALGHASCATGLADTTSGCKSVVGDTKHDSAHTWDECKVEQQGQANIRVLTWNTLADGLAQNGEFEKVPSQLLEWGTRAPVLLQELESSGADVICLQEVNHFDDWFLPRLEELGYSGRFQPKILSPSARFGYAADGVALFYKTSRFQLHDLQSLQFVDSNGQSQSQCALLCRLKERETGNQVLLATTHLKAKTGAENDAMRASQIKQLLERVSVLATDPTVPVILCGDFNCSPDSDVCSALQTHEVGLSDAYSQPLVSSSQLEGDSDVSVELSGGNRNGALMEKQSFTTWKFRPGGEKKETIDYIWYRGLNLIRRKRLPSASMIGCSALPSQKHPSDHLPLCCDLHWPS